MKALRFLAIFLTVLLIYFFSAEAQESEISLSSKLSKADIKFEETTDLEVTVKWWGDKSRYLFEAFPLPETQNLMVQGTSTAISSGVEEGDTYVSRTYKYTFKPTEDGVGVIEPITLKYIELPDSIPGELSTQRFQVLIAAPKVVPSDKEGISGLLYIIGGLVILGAVGAVIIFIKAGNRGPEEDVRAPEEVFIEKLGEIRKESGTDRKQFFSKLYKLLVGYIGEKHNIETIGRTTRDISDDLEKSEIDISQKEKLGLWLTIADKEKYAPHAGEPGDIIRLTTEMEKHFRNLNK